MKFADAVFSILEINPYTADWGLGLPLIVLTVVIHVVGLELMSQSAVRVFSGLTGRPHARATSVVLTGAATLLATCLHGLEAAIWAAAYWLLGALPDFRSSVLYSLNAMTSYGHTNLSLEDHWQLMGALEALNGWLLFGLTTAFLFAVIHKAWLSDTSDVTSLGYPSSRHSRSGRDAH
jgi:hypothetical protein